MLQQFKMVEGMWVTATKQLNRARVWKTGHTGWSVHSLFLSNRANTWGNWQKQVVPRYFVEPENADRMGLQEPGQTLVRVRI
jgi:hypothetical protein